MNGPLSIIGSIDIVNSANLEDFEKSDTKNREGIDITKTEANILEKKKLIGEDKAKEEEIINAPTERTALVGLDERLKRSLETPLESQDNEIDKESNEEESNNDILEFKEDDQMDDEVPIQPNIPISYETDTKKNENSKKIIYITMGIVLIITVVGGIVYIT
ncbi:hypothetical protein FG386_000862 [Cryptosporidium ryanae]|uniref:uncharacterized protein n=1 Tax=Cryptosporidium ryanae TaxID=515981 RepID=UPI00351A0462|nr:hypothetical protein FG386_000862 [Cryptosporidium ryanae]